MFFLLYNNEWHFVINESCRPALVLRDVLLSSERSCSPSAFSSPQEGNALLLYSDQVLSLRLQLFSLMQPLGKRRPAVVCTNGWQRRSLPAEAEPAAAHCGYNAIRMYIVIISLLLVVDVLMVQIFYGSSVLFISFSRNLIFSLCMTFENVCHTYSQLLGIDTVHVRDLLCYAK